MDIAVSLLARRDYSREELKSRLLAKDVALEEILPALESLEQQGIIDDQRIAESLLRSHIAKEHGPARIRQSCLQKGLAAAMVDEILNHADCDWFLLAKSRANKRFGDGVATEPREKDRRLRHLLGQGFSYQQAAYAINDTALEQYAD